VSRFLDPVPLLLGGLAGAIAGGVASYAIDGRVNWPLVVGLLVGTLVTALAILIGAGPTRGLPMSRTYGVHAPELGRGRIFGGPIWSSTPSPGASGGGPTGGGRMGPFDRFDNSAKRILALAQDEAIRFNHNYIGTEHLLLGLLREGEGIAARALNALGVEISQARTAVEFIIGRGEAAAAPSDITLSPRTKKIIELSIDEARQLGHERVGSGHLLLGLIREGDGIGSGVLESLGIDFAIARAKVLELMPKQQPPAPPSPPAS